MASPRFEALTEGAVTEEDAPEENAPSAEALRSGRRGHDPDIGDDAPLEAVRFRLVHEALWRDRDESS